MALGIGPRAQTEELVRGEINRLGWTDVGGRESQQCLGSRVPGGLPGGGVPSFIHLSSAPITHSSFVQYLDLLCEVGDGLGERLGPSYKGRDRQDESWGSGPGREDPPQGQGQAAGPGQTLARAQHLGALHSHPEFLLKSASGPQESRT